MIYKKPEIEEIILTCSHVFLLGSNADDDDWDEDVTDTDPSYKNPEDPLW